jgi:hypothetical protein
LAITLAAVVVAGMFVVLSICVSPTRAQAATLVGIQDAIGTSYVTVSFSDGTSRVQVITWTDPISRMAALKLAGFTVEHNGDSVCSIDGDGCPASDCFCADNWWWQGRWLAGQWDGSEFPPPNVVDGDVIGFHNSPLAWRPPQISAPSYVAAADAFAWLRPLQSVDDGSYSSPFGKMGPTTDMALAVAANRENPDGWRREPASPSLMDYILGPEATPYVDRDASMAGKVAVTLAAINSMPQSGSDACYPGVGKRITDFYYPSTGTFYTGTVRQAGIQSWAMLGMAALSETIPSTAVQALTSMANPDGGWAYHSAWGGSDTMATAQSIQALLAAGVLTDAASIQNGLAFLKDSQNKDGGFCYSISGDSDVSATAYAVQAIVAAGQNPITGTWRTLSGTAYTSPISYLVSAQLPDGSFPAYSPMLATLQVLPALLQRPFPLAIAQVPACATWEIHLPLVVR